MTQGLNKVMLFGNLGAEPELRNTAAGAYVLSFRVATTEVYFDKQQQKQERTEWHQVALFGARAEPLAKLLHKGSRVLVEGRLQTTSYDKDGSKRYKTEVIATDLFLGGPAVGGPAVGGPAVVGPAVGREFSTAARPRTLSLVEDDVPF
ncbi:MAG: single-stranded DNA-binding protein [Deltaproteobacteria bacterium]